MKFFVLCLAAALIFCPPAYTAMEALDNDSLSKVKGSDDNTSSHDPAAEEEESETSIEKEQKTENTTTPNPPSLDCRLKTLHESNEYKKFTFFLKKLERFSNEQDYPELAKSDEFIFFCSCFAETAKKCREKLALLTDGYPSENITPLLIEKSIMFCKADDFYSHLLRYKNGTAPLPDLRALISDIKKCRHNFESMYADINCKS